MSNGNNGGKLRAWAPLIIWVVTTLVAIVLAYGALQRTDTAIAVQFDAHEAEQLRKEQALERRLERMEAKIDRLLER